MTFTLTRMDERDLPDNSQEIRALIVVQNEKKRLTWLLTYYRKMGVDRFLVVDNDSSDGTTEYLLAQPDVHVWHTSDSYGESKYGRYWLDEIRAKHGCGHWCLVVDADEILVFPRSEYITLKDLVSYMEAYGYRGLFTFMLDMYPSGPLSQAVLEENQDFTEVADHFDVGPYFVMPSENFPRVGVNGGLRRRMFFQSGMKGRGPNLRKVPLIQWQDGDSYTSAHSCSPVQLADITGVILHFKYFSDFHEKVAIEAGRKEHANMGMEYSIYLDAISETPEVSFLSELSRKYSSTTELVKLQLLFCSKEFIHFVQENLETKVNLEQRDTEIFRFLSQSETEMRLPFSALSKLWPTIVDAE